MKAVKFNYLVLVVVIFCKLKQNLKSHD